MHGITAFNPRKIKSNALAGSIFILLAFIFFSDASCAAQDHSFRKKLGLGMSIGYHGEYPGSGVLAEWQAFRRVVADVGFAFGNISSEQVYGFKYLMDSIRITKKINPSLFVGCNYTVRYAGGAGIGKDPPFTVYDAPTSMYITPTIGIWGGSLKVDTGLNSAGHPLPRSIICGMRMYLSLNYRIRVAGGDAKYASGPPSQNGERIVNNVVRGGLGISWIAIIDLHIPRGR